MRTLIRRIKAFEHCEAKAVGTFHPRQYTTPHQISPFLGPQYLRQHRCHTLLFLFIVHELACFDWRKVYRKQVVIPLVCLASINTILSRWVQRRIIGSIAIYVS